jgi:transposase
MIHLGIDHHKKYSYVTALSDTGQVHFEAKVANHPETWSQLLGELGDDCRAVLEAGYHWGALYEVLEAQGLEVQVAHPTKLRAIAESQIKTDQRDSRTLAQLLKADLIPRIYIPPKPIRVLKNVLRYRMFLVKLRTMTKNRIHQILDRNRIENPGLTDLFGKAGRQFLAQVTLGGTEQAVFEGHLRVLDQLLAEIAGVERQIKTELETDWRVQLIRSIPGFGLVLATVVALEIDDVGRFRDSGRLASYAGLVPRVYASGGHSYRGPLVSGANHYLKWAFIEAAWKAQVGSPYCRAHFQQLRKHKGAQVAVVALARRLAEIVFKLLKDKRPYKELGILSHA